MADTWLGDFGLRVTNLERSIEFYTKLLDLEELRRVADEESAYVLFRDRRSGQRMELNWYAENSLFWTPYVPGDGLDHLEIRVKDVPAMLERLKKWGIPIATRKMFVNAKAVREHRGDPEYREWMEKDVWESPPNHPHRFRAFYIQDPDGNFLCLYDHQDEKWEDPIPDHY